MTQRTGYACPRVLNRTYDNQNCSVARTLEAIGERWTLLILRDAFHGARRFDDFQRSLGIARNVLTARLNLLTEEGLMERRLYRERPERYEYRLTEKGIDLWPVLFTLMRFGDKHYPIGECSIEVEHRACGTRVDDHMSCPTCDVQLGPRDVAVRRPAGVPSAAWSSSAA
jgi:DNA-binding HxlR family transcriptional regulator